MTWRCDEMAQVRMLAPYAQYTGYAKGALGMLRRLSSVRGIEMEVRPIANTVADGVPEVNKAMLVDNPKFIDFGVLIGYPTHLN